jgi:hypothetical protein
VTDGALSSYGAKTVTTSAQLIAAARSSRDAVRVQNLHASNLLYIGPDSAVTAANGIRIAAGAETTIPSRGDIYAIASAASTDVRYWEIF